MTAAACLKVSEQASLRAPGIRVVEQLAHERDSAQVMEGVDVLQIQRVSTPGML